MATLALQAIVRSNGLEPSFDVVEAGGDEFVNDGRTFVSIENYHASIDVVATFATPATYAGLAIEERVVNVGPNRTITYIGPFDPAVYNDANGKVQITYAGAAVPDTQIAVIQFPRL